MQKKLIPTKKFVPCGTKEHYARCEEQNCEFGRSLTLMGLFFNRSRKRGKNLTVRRENAFYFGFKKVNNHTNVVQLFRVCTR